MTQIERHSTALSLCIFLTCLQLVDFQELDLMLGIELFKKGLINYHPKKLASCLIPGAQMSCFPSNLLRSNKQMGLLFISKKYDATEK